MSKEIGKKHNKSATIYSGSGSKGRLKTEIENAGEGTEADPIMLVDGIIIFGSRTVRSIRPDSLFSILVLDIIPINSKPFIAIVSLSFYALDVSIFRLFLLKPRINAIMCLFRMIGNDLNL